MHCPYAHMCEMNIGSCVYAYMQMGVYITLFAYMHVCAYIYMHGNVYTCNIWMMLVCGCINACTYKYMCLIMHV